MRNAGGDFVFAVTSRNLLGHRASTAIVLGDEIDSAPTAAALAAAWARLPTMARSLMEEAVDPRTIAAVVSSEICIMTRRAATRGAHMQREGVGRPSAVSRVGSGIGRARLKPARGDRTCHRLPQERKAARRMPIRRLGAHMSDVPSGGRAY